MANPLLGFLGGMMGSGNSGGNIFLQAFSAMMRGDSPADFLRSMAQTNPALRGIDPNNISGSAQRLCQERGIDQSKLKAEIKQSVAGMLPK